MAYDRGKAEPIVVVTGADENYGIGLVVTVRSMLQHLGADRTVRLYVLDGGITEETRAKALQSWEDPRLDVIWLAADMDALSHLVTAGHLNHTTYLRLLIPDILPNDCSKAIYLDSDLLIRRDLGLLWDECVQDVAVLAGQETGAPYVDAEVVLAGQPLKYSRVGITTPIRNYQALGMCSQAKVFNAGVLVINVDYWRENRIPQQAYECLEENREYVLFCDQYALNVVLADAWREVDTRWNQTAHFYTYSSHADSPFDEPTYELLRDDPWVCHFTWMHKPWWLGCEHPFAEEYLTQMRRTCWADHQLQPNPALESPKVESPPTRKRRTWKQWAERRQDKLLLSLGLTNRVARNENERKVA